MKLRTEILAAAALVVPLAAHANDQITITTHYGTSLPAGIQTPFGGPSPDSSWVTFTDTGTTSFTGVFSDTAVAGNGVDYTFALPSVTLTPGQSTGWAINAEGSNVGGFNGPTGSAQPGVELHMNGSFSDAIPLLMSINDANIHSGVTRTPPSGSPATDAYVLQGGDSFGFDPGDNFELSQGVGHFVVGNNSVGAPGPVLAGGLPGLLTLIGGLLWWRRKLSFSLMP